MMKRAISMLLVLVLVMGTFPVTAGAAGTERNVLDTPRTYVTFDESGYNDSMAYANWIDAADAYVFGDVGSEADNDTADWFAFTVTGCQRFDLMAVSGAGGAGSTCFALYGADGGLIAKANYYGVNEYYEDSYELEVDLSPGTYYIHVTDSYNWVEYGFATTLRPMLDTPVVTASNRASDGKIKLSWNAVSGAGVYYILRADNEIFINPVLFYTRDTSYIDTSAQAGTAYYYEVYAASADPDYLNSMYCAAVARTCDLPRPGDVVAARNDSTGKVTVSWAAVPGADKYEVYCSTDSGSTWTRLTTVTGTSVTHNSAVLGRTYYYRVRAVDSDDPAANSAYSFYRKGTAVCAQPVITLSNVNTSGKTKISWTSVTGAKSYQLYKSTDGVNWVRGTTTTSTSVTHNTAKAGEVWYYKVRALGSAANTDSAFSSVKYRTCDLPSPTLTVTLTSANKPKLTWTAVSGAVKYDIYRSTDNVNWSLVKTQTGTSIVHSNAKKGVTYYYKIVAVASSSAADSAYSNVGSMTSG